MLKKLGYFWIFPQHMVLFQHHFETLKIPIFFRNYIKMDVEAHVACAYRISMLNIQYAKEIYKFPEGLALKEASQLQ